MSDRQPAPQEVQTVDTQSGELTEPGTIQTDDIEEPFETEVAAFVKVVDRKLTEWRIVADTAFVDEVRATMGLTETE